MICLHGETMGITTCCGQRVHCDCLKNEFVAKEIRTRRKKELGNLLNKDESYEK